MPNYYIQHTQQLNGISKVVYYQGDNCWTTEHEHRKLYSKKKDATAELYDFGGSVVKDRKSTRLNSSHVSESRMPSSA